MGGGGRGYWTRTVTAGATSGGDGAERAVESGEQELVSLLGADARCYPGGAPYAESIIMRTDSAAGCEEHLIGALGAATFVP